MNLSTLITFLQGLVMGVAEIIPGVSGSTLALVMGIYDDFINFLHSISEFAKELVAFLLGQSSRKKAWTSFKNLDFKFGIALFFGMFIANFTLANVMSTLLTDYENYTMAFFFGLVVASVSIPYSEMKVRNRITFGLILVSTIITFIILGFKPASFEQSPSLIVFFLAGVLGICGMILPGVSGSFILLMVGIYPFIIEIMKNVSRLSVTTDDFFRFITFSFGLLVGFIFMVRLLKNAFEKYPSEILAVLIGIMIGSLRAVYPFFTKLNETKTILSPFENTDQYNNLIAILLILIGIGIVVFLNKTKVDRKQVEQIQEE